MSPKWLILAVLFGERIRNLAHGSSESPVTASPTWLRRTSLFVLDSCSRREYAVLQFSIQEICMSEPKQPPTPQRPPTPSRVWYSQYVPPRKDNFAPPQPVIPPKSDRKK